MSAESKKIGKGALAVVCLVLSILLGILCMFNLLLVLSSRLTDMPPSLFGRTPAIVFDDSMESNREDAIPAGSLVVSDGSSIAEAQTGSVVLFYHEDHMWVARVVESGADGLTVQAEFCNRVTLSSAFIASFTFV